jgi:uncharacterized protein YjbJ (UPF0337 family)
LQNEGNGPAAVFGTSVAARLNVPQRSREAQLFASPLQFTLPEGRRKATRNSVAEEVVMNWDQISGNWKQIKGKVKEKWGKLTDDDLTTIAGKKDQLAGKLQERYGYAKAQAERELDEFSRSLQP